MGTRNFSTCTPISRNEYDRLSEFRNESTENLNIGATRTEQAKKKVETFTQSNDALEREKLSNEALYVAFDVQPDKSWSIRQLHQVGSKRINELQTVLKVLSSDQNKPLKVGGIATK